MSDAERFGTPISIADVVRELERPFEPRDLVEVNDAIVRIAAVEGEFPWHHHEEDELFLCWEGALRIEFADREPVAVSAGEVLVVPRGFEHRPARRRPAARATRDAPVRELSGSTTSRRPGSSIRVDIPRHVNVH
jgi:hypothetical protein